MNTSDTRGDAEAASAEHGAQYAPQALWDSDTKLLPADCVSAQEGFRRGSESRASFLLPLRPLPADVKLHTLCKVCSKERANKCAGCGRAAYCSRECQTQAAGALNENGIAPPQVQQQAPQLQQQQQHDPQLQEQQQQQQHDPQLQEQGSELQEESPQEQQGLPTGSQVADPVASALQQLVKPLLPANRAARAAGRVPGKASAPSAAATTKPRKLSGTKQALGQQQGKQPGKQQHRKRKRAGSEGSAGTISSDDEREWLSSSARTQL
ncbi:hypothetical protein OEZ85_009479 [Tetradesmus obliquus]|uniref:MYND-type domain-containing protein n=1 Tax=Tetradesmus obliquus TaxID=3088 RepID=A0ABY8UC02_TETOB|nr:hypothetical protein OEZ85_009479 [Tetradesmus obliquus]